MQITIVRKLAKTDEVKTLIIILQLVNIAG